MVPQLTHDAMVAEQRAHDYLAAELGRLTVAVEAVRANSLSETDVRDIRQVLVFARAYGAGLAALKSVAIWTVAVVALVNIASGGFLEAVRAALSRIKP